MQSYRVFNFYILNGDALAYRKIGNFPSHRVDRYIVLRKKKCHQINKANR